MQFRFNAGSQDPPSQDPDPAGQAALAAFECRVAHLAAGTIAMAAQCPPFDFSRTVHQNRLPRQSWSQIRRETAS